MVSFIALFLMQLLSGVATILVSSNISKKALAKR